MYQISSEASSSQTQRNPILAHQLTFIRSMEEKPLIEIRSLTAGKRNEILLKDINWTIQSGEHWHIRGEMGAGKTTLLHALRGYARVFSGRINYPYLGSERRYSQIKSSIGFVSFTDQGKLFSSVNAVHYYQQRYNSFDSDGHLTAKEYLEDGDYNEQNQEHLEIVKSFDLLPLLDVERIKLSSGQTRKLILCKAFLARPKVLILDNPHIGLDAGSRNLFNSMVDQLAYQFGTTIILSGHIQSLPRCISHCITLDQGRVSDSGPTTNTKGDKAVVTMFSPAQKYALEKIQFHFLSNEIEKTNTPILQLKKVKVSYKDKIILRDLDWTVKQGDKWCVFGENGCGKSTLIGLIYGDHPQAFSNHVSLFGSRRGKGESMWDIKRRMGFVSPELHAYFPTDVNALNVIISGFSDTLFARKPTENQLSMAQSFLTYFKRLDLIDKTWNALSTGEQRLLLFIRALVKAPEVLLLDEPFQGLDVPTVKLCKKLIRTVLTERHTLIFISHFRDEIPLSITQELQLSSIKGQ